MSASFYLDADLKIFPYMNSGLFTANNIELPQLDGEPLRIILEDMSEFLIGQEYHRQFSEQSLNQLLTRESAL